MTNRQGNGPSNKLPRRWNLIGHNFTHTSGGHTGRCGTHGKLPKQIEWCFEGEGELDVYLDFELIEHVDRPEGRRRLAWLLESKSIRPGLYARISADFRRYANAYEAIFTHDRELLALSPVFKFCPVNGPWVHDSALHPKSKLVSAISSNKAMCDGHRWRLDFIERYRDRFDLFGDGFENIQRKELGLNDYMFSVAIENGSYPTYFTEKLLDCFATGTIPIYRGSPDISEYFDPNGILFIDPDGSFDFDFLDEDLYHARLDAVAENFDRVMAYHCAEDWIFTTYQASLRL